MAKNNKGIVPIRTDVPEGRQQRHFKNKKLDIKIANALCNRILSGKPLFTTKQYAEGTPSLFEVGRGKDKQLVKICPATYNSWMRRFVVPIGGSVPLKEMIRNARYESRLRKHEREQKELVEKAKRYLKEIQKLPLGTKTKRYSQTKGYDAKRGNYYDKSLEVVETPVNPAMVAQKRMASEFVLERLDQEYAQKSESKNMNVVLSLSELRKIEDKKRENEAKKIQTKETRDNKDTV